MKKVGQQWSSRIPGCKTALWTILIQASLCGMSTRAWKTWLESDFLEERGVHVVMCQAFVWLQKRWWFSFVLVIPHSRFWLRGILPFSTLDLGEVLMQVQHGDVYATQLQGVDTRLVLDLCIFGAPGFTGKGLKLHITAYIYGFYGLQLGHVWDHVRVLVSYDAVETHFSFVFSDISK